MELGAQLYTVRNFTQNLTDFSETLKKVAAIGYKTVQVSGTCEYTAQWLDGELRKNGLRCVLTHYSPDAIVSDTAAVIEKHKAFGCRYIGVGSMPGPYGDYENNYINFCKNFKPAAEKIAKNDCLLMYHNHDREFIKDSKTGKTYMERLAEEFYEDILGFTVDTYWIQAAGGDPALWIKKLSGRVPCVHVKDMSADPNAKMAPVCSGNMNFDAILDACESSGAKYLLVEQDDCYGRNPFECLAESYRNLKERGLH